MMNSSVIKVSDTTFVDTMLASAVQLPSIGKAGKNLLNSCQFFSKSALKKQTNKELKD